jgi:hypothetical protein
MIEKKERGCEEAMRRVDERTWSDKYLVKDYRNIWIASALIYTGFDHEARI